MYFQHVFSDLDCGYDPVMTQTGRNVQSSFVFTIVHVSLYEFSEAQEKKKHENYKDLDKEEKHGLENNWNSMATELWNAMCDRETEEMKDKNGKNQKVSKPVTKLSKRESMKFWGENNKLFFFPEKCFFLRF